MVLLSGARAVTPGPSRGSAQATRGSGGDRPGDRRRVLLGHEGQHEDVGDQAGPAEEAPDGEAEADGERVDAEVGGEAAGGAADLAVRGGAGQAAGGGGGGGRVHGGHDGASDALAPLG